ncbi:MAG: hypothetical protein A3G05_02255 [Candidatus Zambryskibacteria bacterium RIFCSPLOWO2_12_FULL_45_14]|uniref:DUF5667 domain-containing protein n=2 Tax=Candidatus Zambryskiibacteriota TaxID=1817925 RepID=A0A1G2UNF6_9BACT|nr:MAG: hypothetical protein A3H60_01110 [Candidatus Zambryskibacteria bacterium RIFCSPLOWO2_02_FULL_44_12b]OHB14637.1 MAG: hypothetical protein A3G05_02255 [Candidatus Zambryskibacteria bacterium RIFCSPLOWO2_12_FULL_45_14]
MNNDQFKKARPTEQSFGRGIEELKNIRLTEAEKTRILERVFSTPIESPYMKRTPVFAFVYSLILIISISGITYASDFSLPGDTLYPIKVSVVEPFLDVVNSSAEDKIVWETEKVERRIVEAEKLADIDELDDERTAELERKIEQSSRAFAEAVEKANGDRSEVRKEEFRKKFESKIDDNGIQIEEDRSDESGVLRNIQNKSRVDGLRRTAIETINRIETKIK